MRFRILMALMALGCFPAAAQSVEQLQQTARDFQRQGDYDNAIMVLKRALEKEPRQAELMMDLATTYYMARRYKPAAETLQPLLNNANTDEMVYQLAGLIYRSDMDVKEADRIYKQGLKQYPNSGVLHNDYGELAEAREPGKGQGIKWWEKGIELDPSYSGNYYNAARYYAETGQQPWAILYGEIFVNLESFTSRTIEIKNLLYDQYKKVLAFGWKLVNDKNAFEKAFVETINKQQSVVATGVTPETLTALRTRFVLDWFNGPAARFPFRLFDRHQQMLRDGLFDAYNQWLFGGVANMAAFQNWTQTNAESYQAFNQFQRSRLFNVAKGQYYR